MKKLFTLSILAVMLFTSSLYGAPRRVQNRPSVHKNYNRNYRRPSPPRRSYRRPYKEYHSNHRGQVVYVREYVYVNRPHRNPPPKYRPKPRPRHYRR
ncbi:hypothetical protein [Fusobacterium sp. PH5-44]|uniref:hypothetical protein n=1 Tax=unclassified Fusobacterium TaxID=2648384 RepID=UPI003D1C140C